MPDAETVRVAKGTEPTGPSRRRRPVRAV